jgi:hypothetical protein
MKHPTLPPPSPALRAVICLALAASAQAFVARPSAAASEYAYNASVADWFTASETLPAFTKYVVKGTGSPSQTFYVTDDLNKIEVRSAQPNANANAPGTYAGATWTAPEGEQITSITFTYQSVLGPNLQLSVYVGEGNFDTKLESVIPSGTIDNRSTGTSVTWTVPDGVVATGFQFRNWDLIATSGVSDAWRSTIVAVTITTRPYAPNVPESSSWTILAGAGAFVVAYILRNRRKLA